MAAKFIYVFKDSGYDFGVKIGRGGKSNLQIAQSFAPRTIDFIAAWSIPADGASQIESNCTAGLLDFLPDGTTSYTTRNGREWFAFNARQAIVHLTEFFRRGPEDQYWKTEGGGDVYQSPLSRPGRMMIFIHEEYLTGRLKAHAISEWQSPLERRRRYSRNGFAQIMAFTYGGEQCSLESNEGIIRIWTSLMRTFGANPEASRGWLPAGTSKQQLREFCLNFKHVREVDDISSPRGRPLGVRTRYNATDSIPAHELSLFQRQWW